MSFFTEVSLAAVEVTWGFKSYFMAKTDPVLTPYRKVNVTMHSFLKILSSTFSTAPSIVR